MQLLDLPIEILVIVYESLPDVRTLHNLTRTCRLACSIYVNNNLSILDIIISNTYTDLKQIIKATISARQSNGALRYTLNDSGAIEWVMPDAFAR